MAVSFQEPDALHVEVTVSANPIGYIDRDASGSYVKKRTPEGVKAGAEEWFIRKFQGSKEQVLRRCEELCPDRNWRFMLVYGNLKYPEELRSIEDRRTLISAIPAALTEALPVAWLCRGGSPPQMAGIPPL